MALNLNIVSKFNDKGIREAQASFGGIGKSLGKLGAIVAAAFSVRAITNFAKESIAAAEGVAVANARLDQIAKSMGIFGDQTAIVSDRLKAYAEANEFALATDAEVIKATQAKLLTFKELANTADEAGGSFDRATAAAIDLAAAGFGTAEGNAVQLGKALNNPIKGITALTRSGITFTDAEKAKIKALTESGKILEAQNLILSAIETQVGGTALATATASEKMKLAFDNVRETVGGALLPVFNSVADALLPLIEYLLPKLEAFLNDKVVPGLTKAADAFKAFTGEIIEGGGGIGDFFTGIVSKIESFLTGGGLERIFTNIANTRMAFFNAIIAALPGLLEGLIAYIPKLVAFLAEELLPALIKELTGIITQLADLLVALLPKLAESLLNAIPLILDSALVLFNSLIDAVVAITPKLIQTLIDILPKLVKSIVEMLPSILDAAIRLFQALVNAIPVILPMLIKAIFDLLPVIIKTLVDMLPALIDGAFRLFTGIVEGLIKATPQLIRAFIGLIPVMVDSLMKALPELVRAGFELLTGLAQGLIEMAPRILGSAVQAVGETLVNGVKDLLGIRSPSTVFYEVGENVTEGLADGLNETAFLVKEAADNVATQTIGAADQIERAFDKSLTVISSIPGIASTAFEETVRITAAQVRRMAEETEGIFALFDEKGKLLQSYTNYGKSIQIPDVTGQMVDVGKATDDLNAIYKYMGAKTQEQINRVQKDLFGGSFQQAIDKLTGQRTFVDPKTGRQTTIAANDPDAMRLAVERAMAQGLKPLEPVGTSVEQIKDVLTSISTQVDKRGLRPFELAAGGYVDTAALAVVGEAGPEVIMPLDRFESMMGQSHQQAGASYNITINAGVGSDPVSIGRYVTDAIKRYESVSGKVFASA